MTDKKPKFPLKAGVWHKEMYLERIAQLEKELSEGNEIIFKAGYEQGKLDLFKEVEQLICGTSTIDALEGGVIGLDCYYLNADRFNRLKSQLSKSEGAK